MKRDTSMKDKIGIYLIQNIFNNHNYIGQSVDVKKRWTDHRHDLNNNKHNNPYLQNAWNFYKSHNFKFIILEECGMRDLNEREQYWIDSLKPEYNIVKNLEYWQSYMKSEKHAPDGYIKEGESFIRPLWHLWVYAGRKKPDNLR